MSSSSCLNCKAPLEGQDHYCSRCGQKAATHRLSLHEILHDTIHYFTHADKSIFLLIAQLARRPGVVAREYVEGARKKYFNPLNFLLIVAGVVVFMTSTTYQEPPPVNSSRPPATATQVGPSQQIRERAQKASRFIAKYSNVINMVATPLFAFLFFLFYVRGRFNYTEHLVANMYFVGLMMLFYALVIVPLLRISQTRNGDFIIIGVFFLFELVYRAMAYYQFMAKPGFWHGAKAFAVSLLLLAVWVVGTNYLIATYIRTGFNNF